MRFCAGFCLCFAALGWAGWLAGAAGRAAGLGWAAWNEIHTVSICPVLEGLGLGIPWMNDLPPCIKRMKPNFRRPPK